MRHARQSQAAQRRGGDNTSSAWPSIVATTTSLSGAAAGIVTLLLYSDPAHLRVGVGMAAAGAVFSSAAVLFSRREKQSRRELLAEAREDHAAELRFEVDRRETLIKALNSKALESEEIAILFERRLGEAKELLADSEEAREQAEYDLAVLTAWVHQANAAAELTRSAMRSLTAAQPFEPLQAHASYELTSAAGLTPVQYSAPAALTAPAQHPQLGPAPVSATLEEFFATPNPQAGGYPFVPEPVFELGDASPAAQPAQPVPAASPAAPAPRHAAPARTPVDLTPAAAVPLSPILAAAREHSAPTPSAQRSQTHGPSHTPRQSEATAAGGPRPLRSARLSVREDLGFDVAPTVNTAEPAPYLVPGVAMPRQRDGATPGRPVAPERLYRPYLPDNGTTAANPDIVDLTLYDETTQLSKIDGRRTGTA